MLDGFKEDLGNKAAQIGAEDLNLFLRLEYLKSIDARWQDHLENLEALREAVYLRAYGQKNPLLEYKLEGFQIFDRMLMDIRTVIAKKLFKVKIQSFSSAAKGEEKLGDARHLRLGQFSGKSTADKVRQSAQPEKVQVKRSYPKVGRNDPCPCGSGRKYKYCHGS